MKYSVKVSTFEDAGPFSDAPVEDVKLIRAPLAKVLTQLRFPGALSRLQGEAFVEPLGVALADLGYPLIEHSQQVTFQLTPEGLVPQQGDRILNFFSLDRNWQVSLNSQFVSLDTTDYKDRDDFARRVSELVDGIARVVQIPAVARVGYRYVNRVPGISRTEGASLLREKFQGAVSVPEGHAQLWTSVSEAMFSFGEQSEGQMPEDGLLARWGVLRPNQVLDASIAPVDQESWVLDIDAFRQGATPFDSGSIAEQVLQVSRRAYRFFRWAVTPVFMERFGAEE